MIPSESVGGTLDALEPKPGTPWWWSMRAARLERAAGQSAADLALALERHSEAERRHGMAHEQRRQARDRLLVAAWNLMRLDDRRRELVHERAILEQRVGVALAVLSRNARPAEPSGRRPARARLMATELLRVLARERECAQELAGESTVRGVELRALAFDDRTSQAAAAAVESEYRTSIARWRSATLSSMEIDLRRTAVALQTRRVADAMAQLRAVTLSPRRSAAAAAGSAYGACRKRGVDLELRLDRSLLRPGPAPLDPPGNDPRRRLDPEPAEGPAPARNGLAQPFASLLLPIAGELSGPYRDREGRRQPGLTLISTASQTVSAPLAGRVVFAAPFRGFGPLLIIDRGGGYHVLMAGLSQLDVREGASVVAGQAVGEIVARRDEPARLYLELRYRGVPLDPAPRLAAREDKVRS